MCGFFKVNRHGQHALEYLVIIAFALILATPIIFNAQLSSVDLGVVTRSSMAKNALSAIKESAELVYSQGEPARVSFKVTLPSGINESLVSLREISFTLNGNREPFKVYEIVDFNVTGSLPINPGTHTITTKAEGNYVNITY